MSKAVSKIVKATGVTKLVGSLGSSLLGGGGTDTDKQMARVLQQQETAMRNRQADLTLDNVTQIESGGTADQLVNTSTRRRRPGGQSVSSSLGINT